MLFIYIYISNFFSPKSSFLIQWSFTEKKNSVSMEEVQELQLQIRTQEPKDNPTVLTAINTNNNQPPPPPLSPSHGVGVVLKKKNYNWWIRVSLYAFLLLSGQAVATLLGALYYNKGGNSKWMATFVQSAGFPVLFIPYLFILFYSSSTQNPSPIKSPSSMKISLIYTSIGLLMAGDNMLYSYGLLYLPISTYSLLCATQLAFNGVFSFFLNSLKLTPYILNSLVLLTLSASLLGIKAESTDNKHISKEKYAIGFICTLAASAGYSLWLSLMQLTFQKVIKRETVSVILKMQIYPSFVATCACLVGLFASGEWKTLKGEMEMYEEGKVSYVMTLAWTAISWQISSVGSIGLIFEASSLFSNVIGTIGLPVVPIFGVIFFHEKINGLKILALLLALWGFVSYLYQHYIDSRKISKASRFEDA